MTILYYSNFVEAVKVLDDELEHVGRPITMRSVPYSRAARVAKAMFEAAGFEVQTQPPPRYTEDGPL